MWWLLIGLAIGSSGPNGTAAPSSFGSIPVRCLYALERSAADYKRCRRPSMLGELAASSATYPGSASACWRAWDVASRGSPEAKAMCDVDWHLDMEVDGLRTLAEHARANAGGK